VKTCTRCKTHKDLSQFHLDPKTKDLRVSRCKACVAHNSKSWYEKNKETVKAKALGYHTRNRDICIARQRRYLDKNPVLAIGRPLVKYWPGSTPQQAYDNYSRMLEQQNNLCAVCYRSETAKDSRTGKVKRLSVDHDHTTGKVRGLLCAKHNKAVGLLDDSINLCYGLIKYLKGNE
jgi:hypothetical protein